MNKIEEFLKKIKNYFMQIFNKQSIKLIETDTSSDVQTEVTLDEVKNDEQEKEEFFILYENVKNGTIKITDLMINDLIKVQLMMQKEVDIFDEKIEQIEEEVLELDTEIAILRKDKETYEKIAKG